VAAKSSLDLRRDPRALIATRIFDAPRTLVFEAWTDPKHLAQWWGPYGFTTTTDSFDMRPGGVWRFVMHGPAGRDYQNCIAFEEIRKPELIRYRHGGDDDVHPGGFEVTVTFEELGRTTRLTMEMWFPSAAERDRVIKQYGADTGLVQTLARLADFVANRATSASVAKTAEQGVTDATQSAENHALPMVRHRGGSRGQTLRLHLQERSARPDHTLPRCRQGNSRQAPRVGNDRRIRA
jgi:uncharacterized protein YndB with AHSA1/START domain